MQTNVPTRAAGAWIALFWISLLAIAGCSRSDQPRPVGTLPVPRTVATAAMDQLDSDRNGRLSAHEVAMSPALRATQDQLDVDADGAVSREELVARLEAYGEDVAVMMAIPCRVTLGGRALVGAEVVFEPESFMGNPAGLSSGTTAGDGSVMLKTAGDRLPGLYMGWYRIRVSKKNEEGEELVPERYNTRTELGQEIAIRNGDLEGGIVLELESR